VLQVLNAAALLAIKASDQTQVCVAAALLAAFM